MLLLWGTYMRAFTCGLAKIPSSPPGRIYRGKPLKAAEALLTFFRGRCVEFAAITSGSRSLQVAAARAGTEGTVLSIYAHECKALQDLSLYPEEDEEVFAPGASFVVSNEPRETVTSIGPVQLVIMQQVHGDAYRS